jgi:hypothetical protein
MIEAPALPLRFLEREVVAPLGPVASAITGDLVGHPAGVLLPVVASQSKPRSPPASSTAARIAVAARPLSEIIGGEPGVARDPRQHGRADFVIVVEGEDVIRPTGARQRPV